MNAEIKRNNKIKDILFIIFVSLCWISVVRVANPESVTPSTASPTSIAEKPDYIIKWATISPENTVWGDVVNAISKEIEELSNHRIKNIWYFGGVMGDEIDAVRKSKLNQLQGLALLTTGTMKIAPELMAYSLPLLYKDFEEVDCVYDRTWPLIEKIFFKNGYVPLGRADVGFSVIFSKQNLRTPEDFKKAKVWVWAGLEEDRLALQAYGFQNMISLPVFDVLNALQTGMVDTVYATYYTAIALQWVAHLNYMSDVHDISGAYAPAFLILKKDFFESLPPELQNIIKGSVSKYVKYIRREVRKEEEKARLALLRRGMKVMKLVPEYREKVVESSLANYQKWTEKYYPEWLLQGILNARNSCRVERIEKNPPPQP